MQTVAQTKLILFGEHAAVYGHPAVGIALPQKLTVTLSPAKQMGWRSAPADARLEDLLQALPKVFPKLKEKGAVEIEVRSDIPTGAGFGSSGALCVSLARLLGESPNDSNAIWKDAHELEKVFHNTPSGIDTGIAVFGGMCAFHGNQEGLPHYTPLKSCPLHLVVGAIPRASNTGALVSGLKARKEKISEVTTLLQRLGENAKQAIAYLQSSQIEELGSLATHSHLRLALLGLSTPGLDAMIARGIEKGALGGKLSGAGGGGAYFLIARSHEEAASIAQELDKYAEGHHISHLLTPRALTI